MKDRVGSTRTRRKRDKLWKINDKPSKYETTARPEPKVRNPADAQCERLHSLSFLVLVNLKFKPGSGVHAAHFDSAVVSSGLESEPAV